MTADPWNAGPARQHRGPGLIEKHTEHSTPHPLLFTTDDAAAALAVSPRTVHQLRRDGALRATMIGRSVRFAVLELERFIAEHTEGRDAEDAPSADASAEPGRGNVQA